MKGYLYSAFHEAKKIIPELKEITISFDVPKSIEHGDLSSNAAMLLTKILKKNPKVIWLQEGIHNPEAEEMARKKGIQVVFNRCMLAEHQRLF